jgi:hypothetical protein
MPWKPSFPGEVPTLGWYVIDWMAANLAAPDLPEYEPLRLTPEQAQFVLNFYAIDPRSGRRRVRRAVYSRPKGSGKSPFLAAIGAVEGLGDVVPDGWDANGQPVGRPWSSLRTPLVQLAAVSEDQTKNSWTPLLEMLRDGPVVDNFPGLEVFDSFVNLPRGRIEFVTSSATSREGNRPVFCVLDQTEEWKPWLTVSRSSLGCGTPTGIRRRRTAAGSIWSGSWPRCGTRTRTRRTRAAST